MNDRSDPAGYWAEVRAEGPVYGTGETVQHVLGTTQSISPVLALRWLRGEALRIADRLDPDPLRSMWVQPAIRAATVPVPDCPAELRAWATDPDGQREAREHIKDGRPAVHHGPGYGLHLHPVRLAGPAPRRRARPGGPRADTPPHRWTATPPVRPRCGPVDVAP